MKSQRYGGFSAAMKSLSIFISMPALLALSACSGPEPTTDTAEVDDFAARINGDTAQAQPAQPYAPQPPTIAPPRENAAPGAFAPGTATDPASETCNANKMGPFMGRVADDATRANVMTAAAGAANVRFIQPGSDYIAPDPTNPRLNLMLDERGIIRDARCG